MSRFKFILTFLFFTCNSVFCQDELILKSNLVPGNDTVWIFKPADYDTINKYPAVYLLHGWSGNYRSWNDLINLQFYADELNFILICPDAFFDSYYLNSPIIRNSQYETFFVSRLYPEMNKKYAIDQKKIFITGLSMGGGGAMYLFSKNPQLFLSAGSSSGLFDLSFSGNRDKKLSELLGDYDTHKDIFAAYSPVNIVDRLKGSGKQIIFDCGNKDYLFEVNNTFKMKCDELGIPATYISGPGEHNKEYWKKSIKFHLVFFKELCESELKP